MEDQVSVAKMKDEVPQVVWLFQFSSSETRVVLDSHPLHEGVAAAEGETHAGTVGHSCPDRASEAGGRTFLIYPRVSEERDKEAAGFQRESLELPGIELWQHLL